MNPAETLKELRLMIHQASGLGEEVCAMLLAGASPSRFVPLLKEQMQYIDRLRGRLQEFSSEGSSEFPDRFRGEVAGLRESIEGLLESTDENCRVASRKGVRLQAFGGGHSTPAYSAWTTEEKRADV